MNFKQIEMVGFKSFADPIKINFENGITTIVGPNGCGKSNVADAIRWVLGEQSSKTLRGSNMQDVIFKGTEKRKSLSFCEVTLLFNNAGRMFKLEYDEIAITRRLYRSGESEYLLNHTTCRLKDIIDLLHDSGIGKSGYSIIGQGKVDEIINTKPTERRAIFEEAAGIAKFKAKKLESERKLERTQENLTRINDIVSEIDRQLKPLKHQAEVAKKYLELREQLKVLEVNAYIYQHDFAASNKAEIETRIAAITEEMNVRQAELDEVINIYNTSFEKVNTIDGDISRVRDEILNLTVSIEKQAGQTNLIRERLKNCEAESVRLNEELNKTAKNLDDAVYELHNKETAKEAKNSKLNTLELRLKEINEKFVNVDQELKTSENEAQETQRKMFETLSKLGDVKAQISALNAEKESYSSQLKAYEEGLASVKVKLSENNGQVEKSKIALGNLQKEKQMLDTEVNNLLKVQDDKTNELKKVDTELNNVNSDIISSMQRKKMLEDMQREYEGYLGSVKRLLTDSAKNMQLSRHIIGVVASLIKVPAQFETAIEMALGNAVQNVVTTSDDGAKELINYLKQKEYGRVTFLPINTVKPRHLEDNLKFYLNVPGCFGLASSLIAYDKKIENVISNLLGATMIVDDINTAIVISKKSNYSLRVVTLDGDLINPQGSITGGSKKAQVANLLSRENNIELIKANLIKLEKEQTEKRIQQTKLVDEMNMLTANVKKQSAALHELDITLAGEQERYNKYVHISTELEREENTLNGSLAKTKQIIESIANELSKINNKKVSNGQESIFDVKPTQFDELRTRRDEYAGIITGLKVDMAALAAEIQSLETDIARLKLVVSTANNIKQEIVENIKLNNAALNSYKNVEITESENTQINSILASLEERKKKLNELTAEKNELSSTIRKLEERRMELNAVVSRLNDKKFQQDLSLQKIDTDIEQLQEKVYVEYELTYASAQDYKRPEFDVKQGLIDINRLRREISGLGNVNVNAIEDVKLLEERHGNLYVQAQDLIAAENDLKQIIKELSGEMVSRFEAEFHKINENFGVVFKELFGGGKARLELVESEDLLEAGVDIIAEPPGKKLSNIALLSGGEKALTAIAILFAILRLRPIPFCLLDEIEAPLDEANVTRFAKYVKRYSNETQFIVITHKKTTMEYADTLYGVTMEEKGVSKIVSVKLTDAVNQIQE